MTTHTQNDVKTQKESIECIEYGEDGKGNVDVVKDSFGARVKVDPKEIKLVRKIDMYMMVSHHHHTALALGLTDPSQCYGLCTFSTSWTVMRWSMESSTVCQRT